MGNKQTNILIELGNLQVKNSTFTDGPISHIVGKEAEVELDSVMMFNSSTNVGHGHGFWCVECEKVTIRDSTFYNLTSITGSAIYLENLDNSDSRIEGNYFEANRANSEGGAVVLANTKNLSIANNTFKRNYVSHIVPSKVELIEFLDDDDDVL